MKTPKTIKNINEQIDSDLSILKNEISILKNMIGLESVHNYEHTNNQLIYNNSHIENINYQQIDENLNLIAEKITSLKKISIML